MITVKLIVDLFNNLVLLNHFLRYSLAFETWHILNFFVVIDFIILVHLFQMVLDFSLVHRLRVRRAISRHFHKLLETLLEAIFRVIRVTLNPRQDMQGRRYRRRQAMR